MSEDDERLPSWHRGELARVQRPTEGQLERGEYAEKAKRLFAAALSRKSKSTIRSYEESIKHFASYLNIDDPADALGYLLSLERLDGELRVLEYMGWMEQKSLSPSTIRLRLSALKFYVKTAYRAQWIDWTLETEGPPQENVKEVEGPSPDQFDEILKIVDSEHSKTASRNRALVYMMAFMALRVSECLGLDMEHIDFRNGTVSVLRKGARRQRDKRTVPHHTLKVMKAWADDRGPHAGPFFCNMDLREEHAGKRLGRSSAWRAIKKIGKKAGVPNLHPHAFRHFATTEALEVTDGNTRQTMKLTGHKSERMINIYEDQRRDDAGILAQAIEDRWFSQSKQDEEE